MRKTLSREILIVRRKLGSTEEARKEFSFGILNLSIAIERTDYCLLYVRIISPFYARGVIGITA